MQPSQFGRYLCLLFILFSFACSDNKKQPAAELDRQADQSFTEYISAYSSGKLQSRSAITVQLAKDVTEDVRNMVDPTEVLSFSPGIRGNGRWITNRVMEFVPDQPLNSGTTYTGELKLDRLLPTDEDHKIFSFGFQVLKQNYDIEIKGLLSDETDAMRKQLIRGEFHTADFADSAAIIKAVDFSQLGRQLTIAWEFDKASGMNHSFTVSGVERREDLSEVDYKVTGRAMGVSRDQRGAVQVPALNDFKVLETRVVRDDNPYVLVSFSDPLKENQDLQGFVTLEGESNLRFEVEENEVKVYLGRTNYGSKRLNVYPGIRNKLDFRMKNGFAKNVSFAQIKPAVRLAGKGTILPGTDGLVFPFEAVNLNAVDVTVIKIFEENVFQFLQVNNLGGDDQLRRVGRPIVKTRVALDESGLFDLGRWNRFSLDLSEIMKTEPGAIYQVRLHFRRAYSLYGCADTSEEEVNLSGEIDEDDWASYDGSNYGEYDSYYGSYYPRNYRYSDRENPCTDSYYVRNRSVSRNVIASDLGLISKIGNDRRMTAFVTDLRTAEPLSGINVQVFDYQQDLLETMTTDGDGKIEVDLVRKPYLMVANRGAEYGYLKLDDGSSLSMSNFNVAGARVKRGLKGFIYGERGVWRPGDDIHLNFILEDKDGNLPANHPVVFELIDPSGTVKNRTVRTSSTGDFYSFPTSTKEADPTGNWLAKVTVGGAEFTRRVKIETVKPNRLKIDLDFGKEKILAGTSSISGDLNVQWLSGVPARSLKAEFDLYLTPRRTRFEDFPSYSFDDGAKNFSSQTTRVFSGSIDENGYAKVNLAINKQRNAPGALTATFSGKVYEPGGDFSIDQFSIPFYPYTHYVGLRRPEGDRRGQLLTDKNHTIEIVSVDSEGKPVDRDDLQFEVYKLDWRWWWDRSNDNLANYVGRNYNRAFNRQKVKTVNGKASVNVSIPDNRWGRYYVRVMDLSSGHSSGSIIYFDWPGWAQDANRPGGASLLAFSADKEDYEMGEKVKLQIPGSASGRALVSIENGSKVVASYWVETKEGQTDFEFDVTEEMVPNAYVHTTLLQPHAQTKNDLPIRLFGVVPINVSDPATKLLPVISTAEVFEPESKVSVSVSESEGKAMTYTVAVVDEGLLDITRFQTPNPWTTFYARQALGVKTWDLYDDVSGALNGDLSRLLAVGGDGSAAKPEKAKANRFKPVVMHLGPFKLAAGETATHSFDMPNYVGSVRTMVVAGEDGAYGRAEKATPVRKPLMVLGTLPRVIGPGEKVKLPVSVFVLDDDIKDVKVSVEGNRLLKNSGTNTSNLQFTRLGDQIVDFEFEVAEELGVGKVQIIAQSGNERATYEVEIQVRNPNPPMTDVIARALEPGESWQETFDQVGMAGTNQVQLELSVIPPINLGKRLDYLMRYPHGCIEQTTSSVFPQLFLADIMDLDEGRKEVIENNIKAGIDRISTFQTDEGGFSYWPGRSNDNDWGTNYGGHFLMEAKNKGYSIPSTLFRNWKSYQAKRARKWSRADRYNDDIVQAYRLYTLALAQSPELGAMNRLREDQKLSLEAKWRLAAAYAISGRINVAKELVSRVPTQSPRRSNYYYYGSQTRDNAMILEALGLMKMRNEGLTLLREVSDQLSDSRWMSTQTTAYALLGVIKFSGVGDQSNGLLANYAINDGGSQQVETAKPVKVIEVPVNGIEGGAVDLKNTGQGVLFARLIKTGQPIGGNETSSASGMRLDVLYTDRSGNPIDPATMSQGTDFFAEISIYNIGSKGVYRDLALSQIFPSGWEILNERLNDIPGATNTRNFDYKDIRDDRVYTYFDLKANEKKIFKVALNATYAGRYYLPGVNVEAMYDNTVNARVAGKWVEVKRVN
ncbi:MAG: hypothetical protein HEP71_19760 [Roseivirga sp.]|nr:hypothetical protein [Roseivirga sp.]